MIGDDVSDASDELRDAGFTTTQTPVDSRAPAGTVVGQNPRGTSLPDQQITLTVSTGRVPAAPQPPVVPAAAGPGG